MSTIEITDINSIPLDRIDVRQPDLFKNDNWQPLFARLRNEAPVHYLADSVNGPFWSITSHEMIKAVDSNSVVFSSEKAESPLLTLTQQRKAVAPTVAPKNLAELEPLICERATDILDNLPIGETFN